MITLGGRERRRSCRLKMVAHDWVSRQHRRCVERVGPEACRSLVEVSRESDACEVGGFFRAGGALISLQHRAKPRFEQSQVLGSRGERRRAQNWVGGRRAWVDACQSGERGLAFAGINQGPPEEEVARRKAGLQAHRFAELGDGVVEPPSRLESVGERLVHDRQFGKPTNRFLLLIDRRGKLTPVRERQRDLVSNHPIVGLRTASLAKLGVGLVPLAEPEQGGSERDVGKGIVGSEPDHLTKNLACLRRLAAAQQGPRQAAQGQAAAGTNTRRHVEVPDRLLGTTRDQELASEVGVDPEIIAVERLSPPQQPDSQLTPSQNRQRPASRVTLAPGR